MRVSEMPHKDSCHCGLGWQSKERKTSWEILWLKERNSDPMSIHKRGTLIPSSLITERKDNAAIVWFCILKPLSCPCSLITVPQTIKLKCSDLKHVHLLSPDPLVLCWSVCACFGVCCTEHKDWGNELSECCVCHHNTPRMGLKFPLSFSLNQKSLIFHPCLSFPFTPVALHLPPAMSSDPVLHGVCLFVLVYLELRIVHAREACSLYGSESHNLSFQVCTEHNSLLKLGWLTT